MSNVFRKIKRNLAKENMRKEGKKQFCKHSYSSIKSPTTGQVSVTKHPSFFAENWRDYWWKEEK